jgi:two-component system, NtrC family, sensor kinase
MRTTSIRAKTTAGYVLTFSFVLLVAVALFADLAVVEERVVSHAAITRFLDATLEMRRYEKNFLLYRHHEDLEAALRYAAAAAAIVPEARLALAPPRPEVDRLLADYGARLRAVGEGKAGAAEEAAVRELGRRITDVAERHATAEGARIQEMLRRARAALAALVIVLLVGAALIARVVVRTALQPLKELESGMRRIASGELRLLPLDSATAEIRSMNGAFNRMMLEILEHRREAIRKERLASLGTMLAGIAHELNNPLSNLSTSAELLREGEVTATPAERRELVDQIVSEADRATDIIRTVLDFSRGSAFERRPTNLLQTVLGSVVLVRGDMPAHVAVEMDVPADLEISADKAKLQQAFINILSNAVDAMRDAHREGRIAISARSAGEAEVEVAFRDTGGGIPADVLDRVFDPFFSTKDVGRGTGLGLYLTHQIVEQHGGTIDVESELGKGTTFTVRLPRRDPAEAGAAGPARAEAPRSATRAGAAPAERAAPRPPPGPARLAGVEGT